MSGFHALFSIGGFLGSWVITALLSRHIVPSTSAILSSAVLVLLIGLALPRMLSNREATSQPLFAVPKGVVLVIALLAAISFLVEVLSSIGAPCCSLANDCSLQRAAAWDICSSPSR